MKPKYKVTPKGGSANIIRCRTQKGAERKAKRLAEWSGLTTKVTRDSIPAQHIGFWP